MIVDAAPEDTACQDALRTEGVCVDIGPIIRRLSAFEERDNVIMATLDRDVGGGKRGK